MGVKFTDYIQRETDPVKKKAAERVASIMDRYRKKKADDSPDESRRAKAEAETIIEKRRLERNIKRMDLKLLCTDDPEEKRKYRERKTDYILQLASLVNAPDGMIRRDSDGRIIEHR